MKRQKEKTKEDREDTINRNQTTEQFSCLHYTGVVKPIIR
jgi:hypothetical protein